MPIDRHEITAEGIALGFEPDCGMIADLTVTDEGQAVAPMHRVPWIGEDLPADTAPHLRRMQGDFFCAPFGGTGQPGELFHGYTANTVWRVMPRDGGPSLLRAVLDQTVRGALAVKELSVADGHPFLYQRHMFIGGTGDLTLANHAMVSLPNGGRLSFSRKRWFENCAAAPEGDAAAGRSMLAYPRRSEDPTAFPNAAGGTVNLLRYPWAEGHEEFMVAVEEPTTPLGWSAVVRPVEGDLYLSLRNPRVLPMTMLWHSNGGRDLPPWSGRHLHCLGVEEGAALGMLGLSSQESPDPLSAAGQPGALTLIPDGMAEVRHVTGAIRWPSGQPVAAVQLDGDVLTVTGDWGAERKLPFRGDYLRLPGPVGAGATPRPDRDQF